MTIMRKKWGYFEVLDQHHHYLVKRMVIEPYQSISLQKHLYRSEHWVLVEGKAYVTRGKKRTLLHANQSIFIPQKMMHRIENPLGRPIALIEIQFGVLLSEEDIVRYALH